MVWRSAGGLETAAQAPAEIIEVGGEYYIHAGSSRVDDRTLVLKHGESFGVFDRYGDIHPVRAREEGLFHRGTRFLSHLDVRLGEGRPLLLNSATRREAPVLVVDLTNPDIRVGDVALRKGDVHVFRAKVLREGSFHDRLRFTSFRDEAIRLPVTIQTDADFADIFEVRGHRRAKRGLPRHATLGRDCVTMSYVGLDDVTRTTHIRWSEVPVALDVGQARFELEVPPHGATTLLMSGSFHCHGGDAPAMHERPSEQTFVAIRDDVERATAKVGEGECQVSTTNERFDDWLVQSVADLHMMVTDTPHGFYPYAGVPWFSAVFGRDGLITALESLLPNPRIMRGVLHYLAAEQATTDDARRDAEPGKVLHELRLGEMAALGEVPFGRYYGSVDATPLFVLCAARYLHRTGDVDFLRGIWPNVRAALEWMRSSRDASVFVRYDRRSRGGLANQGWKDSHDAVFHADGSLAEGPVALAEVQGYAFAAFEEAALAARILGDDGLARELEDDAGRMRRDFESRFWRPRLGTYAVALDGHGDPCDVVTSNAGQVLLSGIASDDRARSVARRLLDEDGFSGWGVRTLAAGQARYNPLSYHNGSVWPHDNALIALGFARYGLKAEALAVLEGMFQAAARFDHGRLPELFAGFPRRDDEDPTRYPLACAPQAWAAAAPFLMLQAVLGLRVEPLAGVVVLDRPVLPSSLDRVSFRRLAVDTAGRRLDLSCLRSEAGVLVDVENRVGEVDVVTVK